MTTAGPGSAGKSLVQSQGLHEATSHAPARQARWGLPAKFKIRLLVQSPGAALRLRQSGPPTTEKDPAMLLDADESQLVLVDYQALDARHPRWPGRSANARLLARVARTLGVPVGTEQNPSRLGANDADLRALCDRTLEKCASALRRRFGRMAAPARQTQQGGNARSLPKHLQKPAQQA